MRIFDYKHIYCECGGAIGSFDRGISFTCERCKKVYPLYDLNYDEKFINDKTGWIFPMVKR